MRDLLENLKAAAKPGAFKDGRPGRFIDLEVVRSLARSHGMPSREIEARALDLEIVPQRYARNMALLECRDQARLLRSTVSVAGLGGLGGFVAEFLARMGVGSLTLADHDRFDETNLNRQLYCTEADLGHSKALVAAQRIQAVNSSLTTTVIENRLDALTFPAFLNGAQVVVDCLDNHPSRSDLARAADQAEIPLVTASVAGLVAQVSTDARTFADHSGPEGSTPEDRLGTLVFAPALAASCQAGAALAILLGHPSPLDGRMLAADLEDMTFAVLNL
ncbi:MAG: HesA/MoeB/ThiF family protein [Deltaproteobacteria bacterium]|nr:HesA/MoeB/ThiF family protein [Deltaproteobacteria bacterium]